MLKLIFPFFLQENGDAYWLGIRRGKREFPVERRQWRGSMTVGKEGEMELSQDGSSGSGC